MHNILIAGVEVLGGGLLFVIGYRFGLFDFKAPEWVGTKFWYLKIAEGFLQLLQVIAIAKKKLSETLLTYIGSSAAVQQREWSLKQVQIEEALEDEKISTVRKAIQKSNISMIRKGIPSDRRHKKVNEMRESIGRDALRAMLLKKRILRGAIWALERAAIPIGERPQKLSEIMGPISEVAQTTGLEGLDDLRTAIENFNENVERNPQLKKGSIIINLIGGRLEKRMNSRVETRQKWKELVEYYERIEADEIEAKKTFYEKFNKWIRDMLRILAEILAAGRLPWRSEEQLMKNQIAETRNSIEAYTRDVTISIIVCMCFFIFITVVLFVELLLRIY